MTQRIHAASAAERTRGPPAAPAAQAAAAMPQAALTPGARSAAACACGGDCPRCSKGKGVAPQTPLRLRRHPADEAAADAFARGGAAPRKTDASSPIDQALAPDLDLAVKQALAEPHQRLDPRTRDRLQPRTGFDLGSVRVHSGASARDSARALNAKAYSIGSSIVVGPGVTARSTLGHEVGHIVAAGGRSQVIQRQERHEGHTDEEPADDGPVTTIQISLPPLIWFTRLDGRWLIRLQADTVAQDFYGYSDEQANELFRAQRLPDIASPEMPADRFVQALEDGADMALLPDARASLLARGAFPLRPYDGFHYAVPLDESQLTLWFGASRWREYLGRPASAGGGTGGRPPPEASGPEHRRDARSRAPPQITPAPMHASRRSLERRPDLSRLYLAMLEHFAGLHITPELTEQAADGLSGAEIDAIVGEDATRGQLTDLFTQGWQEFVAARGREVLRFEPLAERLLEQYLRGNLVARANLLQVGHGWPERSILGIVHRRSNLLLYDNLGLPMTALTGIGMRDIGYLGYEPPELATESDGELAAALGWRQSDQLLANLMLQATGVDDTVMIAQAARHLYDNTQRCGAAVSEFMAPELRRVLGETIAFVAVFMLLKAVSRLMMRIPNPIAQAIGAALALLIEAAGYILGLSFLSQTWSVLVEAAFHISRIRNDDNGQPTQLSLMHIEQAAHPTAILLANVIAAMGTLAFGLAVRRIRGGTSRGVIGDPQAGLREIIGETDTATDAAADPAAAAEPAAAEGPPADAAAEPSPAETPPTTRPRMRPSWQGWLRARLLAAVMRGVVEGAPPTGGTGGGSSGAPVEPLRPGISSRASPARPTTPATPAVPELAPPVAESAPSTAADPAPPTAADPAAPSTTPVTPSASPQVWVNTRSGVFHRAGSRWYGATAEGSYMTEAQASANGYTEAGAPRATPPTGVYGVERPERGDPRIVLRAWLGPRQVRAGLEREMMSAAEYGVQSLQGMERAHSTGAGLGAESGEGIRLAPEVVNQAMQNRGIEAFLRALRDIALQTGERIHLTTETQTHARTLRLASIHYIVEVQEGDRMITLFEAAIEVRRDGRARCGVRMPGSDTTTWGPWFSN